MTMARSLIVDEDENSVYHCWTRCVRRAFLCGWDEYARKDFSHRQKWVRDRLEALSRVFAVDVFAYAVMSNHLHVVIRNRPDVTAPWSEQEVARRWLVVFPRRRTPDGKPAEPTQPEIDQIANDANRVSKLRRRLSSVSWFMRLLNEHIARRANREDDCRGRFWEGRFKCQRLLDEAAILTCMTYVDLNPVRARVVQSLTDPQFTSAFERIEVHQARKRLCEMQDEVEPVRKLTARQQALKDQEDKRKLRAAWLASLDAPGSPLSHVSEESYLQLLDWAGREVRADKPGSIPTELAPLLTQVEVNTHRWIKTVRGYGSLFFHVAGRVEQIAQVAERLGRSWLCGIAASREAFTPSPHAG